MKVQSKVASKEEEKIDLFFPNNKAYYKPIELR